MGNQSVLKGIRILDFTWVLAGPFATRLLADFGAEVIKVQPLMSTETDDAFSRGYYNTWNRNKLGITLNMNKSEGIAIARRLVGISDAVVENFAPRVMDNWGLDYENLKKIKADIIMVSLSFMGHTGPFRNYVGYAPSVHAASGMTYLSSFPGKPPIGLGFSYADHVAGLRASAALLGALEHRRKTGEGQFIDISEVEAMVGMLGEAFQEYTETGKAPEPRGNWSSKAAPHNIYRCRGKDRWCAIGVFTDEEWQGFKRALGNPAWIQDVKFNTLASRFENLEELDRLVGEWAKEQTAEDVMKCLQKQGVAAGVVRDAAELAKDLFLKERGFFVELEHPEMGKTISDATPIKLSEAPARYERAAPTQGQDNDYVYKGLLGLDDEEMVELREQGVI